MSTRLADLPGFPQEWVEPLAAYNLTTLDDFLSYCRMENGRRNLAGVVGADDNRIEAVEREVSVGINYSEPPPVDYPMGALAPDGSAEHTKVVPLHLTDSDDGPDDA